MQHHHLKIPVAVCKELVDATSSLENSSGSLQRAMTPDAQIASTSNVQEAMTPDAQIASTSNVHRAVLDKSIPLEDIVNIPKLPQPKTKQASRKIHSAIITSTPMKDILEEKEQKKKNKEQMKKPIRL
ncbi:hypothetical protein QE152_g10764 [Popillia japonica]|uniref:Uncharacterized protein n=1 Tax=Popillia japonica TaxID=7064 RepID=A0AAW1LU97_POPJA